MRYIEVGGARVSAVGLGTWQFGSPEWGYGSDYDSREAGEILRRALDLGATLIDTAEIYGFGRSEKIVGRALGSRRDDAFLASKILPVLALAPVVEWRAAGSLRRLGTDRLDLYQLHQPNPVVPLSQTMRGFAKLADEHKVVHAGVSNYSLARWKAAEEAYGRPVLSNQVRYNLLDRRPETEILGWAQKTGRIVIAYSPVAQGLLSGRYDAVNQPPGKMRSGSAAFSAEHLVRVAPVVEVLREVASAHQATPAQVALAWLLRRPNVVVIPGASSVAQVEANAAAAELELKDDEDRALTEASDNYRPLDRSKAFAKAASSRFRSLVSRAKTPVSSGPANSGPGNSGPGNSGSGNKAGDSSSKG
jgi:aryl-alcohol dehydrogenase-like predicted oxidoreductase